MHEDDSKVQVELPKCDNPDCEDCGERDSIFEGTVQEALQLVHDEALERDRVLMELITEQAQTLVALYGLIEALASGSVKVVSKDAFTDIDSSKLN